MNWFVSVAVRAGLQWGRLAAIMSAGWLFVQAGEPDALPMILELLRSADRDTRGLALQQVRDGLPGQSVTRTLTDQLPLLSPASASALLEALGDRGDPAARSGVLKAATSDSESVRVAALGALARLGTCSDVPLLAEAAASGSALERETARNSLAQLRGQDVNAALVEHLRESKPAVQCEILRALARRRASGVMTEVLRCASSPESSVRLAALATAETLATPSDTKALIGLLASARDERERTTAESALLALSRRGREQCRAAMLAALPDADATTRLVLLQALAVIGGPEALATISQSVQDAAPPVRDQAVRLLSEWPTPDARAGLLQIAEHSTNAVHRVVALRGLVRLATEPSSPDLAQLRRTWQLAQCPEEKSLVLGALSASATTESLGLAAQALDDPRLVEEAALAVVLIAEKLNPLPAASRSLVERARAQSHDAALRERAGKLLSEAHAE
jgi:HEAT repeat protein